MNQLSVFSASRYQKHDDSCEVCFDAKPTDIILITCTHRQNFCETCMRSWFKSGKFTCPKCRTFWPVKDYLEKTNQSTANIANVSLKLKYPTSSTANVPPPTPLTAGDLMHSAVMCSSIGLLICLIVYPALK